MSCLYLHQTGRPQNWLCYVAKLDIFFHIRRQNWPFFRQLDNKSLEIVKKILQKASDFPGFFRERAVSSQRLAFLIPWRHPLNLPGITLPPPWPHHPCGRDGRRRPSSRHKTPPVRQRKTRCRLVKTRRLGKNFPRHPVNFPRHLVKKGPTPLKHPRTALCGKAPHQTCKAPPPGRFSNHLPPSCRSTPRPAGTSRKKESATSSFRTTWRDI